MINLRAYYSIQTRFLSIMQRLRQVGRRGGSIDSEINAKKIPQTDLLKSSLWIIEKLMCFQLIYLVVLSLFIVIFILKWEDSKNFEKIFYSKHANILL
jgi:hypothetical protein